MFNSSNQYEYLTAFNNYLFFNGYKEKNTSYLLPLRIKETSKNSYKNCLDLLVKERKNAVTKEMPELKEYLGKKLYYYYKKYNKIEQKNVEYFIGEFIKGISDGDYKENKYLTKKEYDENKKEFIWPEDDYNERIILFYKKNISDDDKEYIVKQDLIKKFYNDKNFKIDGKNLNDFFKLEYKKRSRVFKSEDKKSLTITERYIVDNLEEISLRNGRTFNMWEIFSYAYDYYIDCYNTTEWEFARLIIENTHTYIEERIVKEMNKVNSSHIKFSKEKLQVVIDNLDTKLMAKYIISKWCNENLEYWMNDIIDYS